MSIGTSTERKAERYSRRRLLGMLLPVVCSAGAGNFGAFGQRKPEREPVILTVSWADNRVPPVRFALKDIEKLERKDYMAKLPPALGVSGRHDWQGIPVRAVLAAAKAQNYTKLRVAALDGYEAYLPVSDLTRFDPILAYRKDDQYIGILDRGPLLLIYPFDSNPQLQTMEYINRTIWQVNAIVLQ